MKSRLLRHLVCPETGDSFEAEVHQESHGEIKEGYLKGIRHGCIYPIKNFVPRFVTADEYTSTFSHQRDFVRRHFDHYKVDRSGYSQFYPTTGFTKERLFRGLTLEVGCGYGRFIDVVSSEGGEIVGIDLSSNSIELAQLFVGTRPNVHLVQCDLFKLPFRKGTFDRIYSIGVLHHTPECKMAFHALSPHLSQGGQISIWLYHPSNQRQVTWMRPLTTTLSPSHLYVFCVVNQFLFGWIRRIPGIGWRFSRIVPGNAPRPGQHFWLRVMEDFDNLSPKHASSHTPEEVLGWFKEAGLSDIRILSRLTAVTGFRQ